jgi:hypothetical protein
MKTIATLVAIVCLTGCSLTVAPDGARTWSLNGEEAARAVIIISEK